MPKAFTYEKIKNYISKPETGNYCKLLTTKEEFESERTKQNKCPTAIKLNIQCRCGTMFNRNFNTFKVEKKECDYCSGRKKYEKIEAGNQYGNWIVISKSKKTGTRKSQKYWICQCQCKDKTIKEVTEDSLKQGLSTSCGCMNKEKIKELGLNSKRELLIGSKFNMLTVIKYHGKRNNSSKHHKHTWLCQCDCGNKIIVETTELVTGHTKSCGCLKHHNLVGEKFGKLSVIETDTKNPNKFRTYYNCMCECGNIVSVRSDALTYGNVKSCGCVSISKGEMRVREVLDKYHQNYTSQFTFDDCVYKYPLRFDFHLMDYNCCIEYDGKQHYVGFDFFGGEEAYKQTQKRDKIKNEYCKKHNIKLVRIPYWEFENVEQILTRELDLKEIT